MAASPVSHDLCGGFPDQFRGGRDNPQVQRKLLTRIATKTFRRPQITWAHAACVHNQLLKHQTGIDVPQLEHVITRLPYHMLRGQDAHAVFHGAFPFGLRVVRMHVDNLRCFVIKRDAVAKPGTRLKFLRGREIYVDTDWTIMKQIHAVFEPTSSRGQYLTRCHDGKGRHRRQPAPKVGNLLPLNSLRLDDAREILGFNPDIPVRFDKAFDFFRPWRRWIHDWPRHDYFAIHWTGDSD